MAASEPKTVNSSFHDLLAFKNHTTHRGNPRLPDFNDAVSNYQHQKPSKGTYLVDRNKKRKV